MRLAFALLLFVALSFAAPPPERRKTEVVKPTTPEQDRRANSAEVPEVYAINGKLERVVVLRFKFQADLLAGLERMIAEQKIKNAVVLSGIGSVRGSHYHVVSNRDFPSKNTFVKDEETPADIASINGYVINGKLHAHIVMTDADKAYGGHIEPGTQVFTFAVVTLGVFSNDVDLKRADDKTYR